MASHLSVELPELVHLPDKSEGVGRGGAAEVGPSLARGGAPPGPAQALKGEDAQGLVRLGNEAR